MSETRPWLEMLRGNADELLKAEVTHHCAHVVQQWLRCHVEVGTTADPVLRQLIEYLEHHR